MHKVIRIFILSFLLAASGAPAARAHELPLGDGKISTTPKTGYLMSCVQHWGRTRVHGGPWIQGDQWNPAEKPSVEGNVTWPTSRISITIQGDERIISANNLPDHATGRFPIAYSDPAYRYDPNPNSIRPQNILLRLPLHPKMAAQPSCVPMGMVGFTTDGVAIYNAVDAGGADAVAHEVQDKCNGHPQGAGQYHYHGPSPCMPNEKTSGLVGYAIDGFGIYGMKDRATGRVLHNSDLDACHGTTSPVMWDGKLVNMYHYVLTQEYPYTIGCFKGTPVRTGLRPGQIRQMNGEMMSRGNMRDRQGRFGNGAGRQGSGGMGMGRGNDSRRQRLVNAARTLGISFQKLRSALGPPPPDLQEASAKLGIPVETLRSALGAPSGQR